MSRRRTSAVAAALVVCWSASGQAAGGKGTGAVGGVPRPGVDWPSFRGIAASGVSDGHQTVTDWDVTAARNVRWRVSVPGLAHSSPVIWGDRLYVTTAVSGVTEPYLKVGLYGAIDPVDERDVQEWRVYCLDKRTGKTLWQRAACAGVPKVRRHTKSSHANPTPATDGRCVVAFFGSEGLYCFDSAGTPRWQKDLGVLDSGYYRARRAQWGFASSPVIHGDTVVVQCDVQECSFVAAFSLADGRELWRAPREDVPTWGTPTVVDVGAAAHVVVNGHRHIGGYELASGRAVWHMSGGGDIPVPTPVSAHGLLFIASAHGRVAPLYAIRNDAAGDVTLGPGRTSGEWVAWSNPRNGAYMQTPLVYGDHLYSCRDNGLLTCYDARTGQVHYKKRLPVKGGCTASPVAAAGRIYFAAETGRVVVVAAGDAGDVLGTPELGDICMATPALSEGVVYFRTRRFLTAIGRPPVE